MTRSLTFRPRARADLADIWTFTLDRWSETQADRYFQGLDETLVLLCAHPEIARLNTAFTPPAQIFPYRSHLLIFTADETTLEVFRVVHARSNWQGLVVE